jgi:23S rRNA-/tRNA-specific pseudouridylate synthase
MNQATHLRDNIKERTQDLEEDEGEINRGLKEPLEILYQDEDMIVINKPPFAQTAPGFREQDSAATRIAAQFAIDRVDHMIVHRLDYATSGIVVFARNKEALKVLHQQFRQADRGGIYKEYSALVAGRMESWEGEIDLPIAKDMQRGPPFCTIQPDQQPLIADLAIAAEKGGKSLSLNYFKAKHCQTHWMVAALGPDCSLLRLWPRTGR